MPLACARAQSPSVSVRIAGRLCSRCSDPTCSTVTDTPASISRARGRSAASAELNAPSCACHASPGSQTAGFDQSLDPTVVIERVARTDARVIVCGHTHLPEVRDLGWKVIVNDGSAGYVFDGDPTATWALIDIAGGEVTAEIRREEFDALGVANAISARGLPGDVYRAATVRTGKLVR